MQASAVIDESGKIEKIKIDNLEAVILLQKF